jgi:hypothetical protein
MFRKLTLDIGQILPSFTECIGQLYQGTLRATEQLSTKEWVMVGTLGDDSLSGIIQACHRIRVVHEALSIAPVFGLRIRDSGLLAQNYDKGMDRYIRKFGPVRPRQARPRVNPGSLYYPNEFSYVFEKYWNHLPCLDPHPDFADESEYAQGCMTLFSQDVSRMPTADTLIIIITLTWSHKAAQVSRIHAYVEDMEGQEA